MTADIIIPVLLLIVAFLYASVGHGGASGYIAVLTLFSIPLQVYKPVVLVLNIIIAGIGFIQFYRAGYFKWKLAWPFLITSIPCAYIGSYVVSKFKIDAHIYNLILGVVLIFPVIRFLYNSPKYKVAIKELDFITALICGAIIGLVSGFLNIGGGIFLSPVIILLAYGNTKDAASVSSLFIVCNSAAGLYAVRNNFTGFYITDYIWIGAAIAGGFSGAYFGSHKFKLTTVRYILSAVLCIAAVKLIIDGIKGFI